MSFTIDAAYRDGPVDLIGFSFGGFGAQQIALDDPALVRRMILAGRGPAGGKGGDSIVGVTARAILKAALTRRDPKYYLFFTSTANGRNAAEAFLARLNERTVNRDKGVGPRAFFDQLKAIKARSKQGPQPLEKITCPVLVVNGDSDAMVPSENSRSWPSASTVPNWCCTLMPDTEASSSIMRNLSSEREDF